MWLSQKNNSPINSNLIVCEIDYAKVFLKNKHKNVSFVEVQIIFFSAFQERNI